MATDDLRAELRRWREQNLHNMATEDEWDKRLERLLRRACIRYGQIQTVFGEQNEQLTRAIRRALEEEAG